MKGINQGLGVAAPERLWSDLVPDADSWGRQPPFTRMLLGCVTRRPRRASCSGRLWAEPSHLGIFFLVSPQGAKANCLGPGGPAGSPSETLLLGEARRACQPALCPVPLPTAPVHRGESLCADLPLSKVCLLQERIWTV